MFGLAACSSAASDSAVDSSQALTAAPAECEEEEEEEGREEVDVDALLSGLFALDSANDSPPPLPVTPESSDDVAVDVEASDVEIALEESDTNVAARSFGGLQIRREFPPSLPTPKEACKGDCTTFVCLYKKSDEAEDKGVCEKLLKEKAKAPNVGVVRARPETEEERKALADELKKSACKNVVVISAGHGMGTGDLCTTTNVCSSAVVSVGGTLHFIELGCGGLPIVDQKDAICRQLTLPAGCMVEANQLWSFGEPYGGVCNSRVVIVGTASGTPKVIPRPCDAMKACANPGGQAQCTKPPKEIVTKTCCLDPRSTTGAQFADTCSDWSCRDVVGKTGCYGGGATTTQTCVGDDRKKVEIKCCGADGKDAPFAKPGTYCKK